jgi:hypothetical protein
MAVAVKALDRRRYIASERYATIGVMNTFGRASGAVTAEFDTITVTGERCGSIEIILNP